MKRKILRFACFMICLAYVLGCINAALKVKNYDTDYVRNFYEQDKNTIDVLVLGNSHSYMAIYPSELWEQHGYAAYCFGGSGQPIWITYHFLKEALKTQKPKLIVLEPYGITTDESYSDDVDVVCSTYGMKWSLNKLEAVFASVPPGRRAGHILEYTAYHDRYRELTKDDFYLYKGKSGWKGALVSSEVQALETPDISAVIEDVKPLARAEVYYRKIIELAKDHQIPILVTAVPYALSDREQGIFLYAADIAAEYDVPFLNYNGLYAETGINFITDLCDNGHLNRFGARKVTTHLGNYIAAHYDLPDRRGDTAFASWDEDVRLINKQILLEHLRKEKDYHMMMRLLNADPSYTMLLSFNGESTPADPEIGELLESLGVKADAEQRMILVNYGSVLQSCPAGEQSDFTLGRSHVFLESKTDAASGRHVNTIMVDGKSFPQTGPVENGMDVLIYDVISDEIVLSFHTWRDNGYQGFEWTTG